MTPSVHSSARRWAAAVAVVAVLVAVAVVVNRATRPHTAGSLRTDPALVARADLDPCPASTHPPVAGGLPTLRLPCLGTGRAVDLAGLRGPLLVNIWAAPCPPCQQEAPILQRFYAANKAKVGVLGVVDGNYPDTPNDALDAAHGLGLHYPSVFDAKGELLTRLHLTGIPVTLFIAADGSIAGRHIGQIRDGELPSLVARYLGIRTS
ncbi:MAG: TlpA family protein disulfide reductase [Acidothermus sp.]|nr:TlpA family protein disulfide reductase [Acidothermus sp.]MCL6537502.1 TlpA family protein disulfide reductase [Acidothermus sp.]